MARKAVPRAASSRAMLPPQPEANMAAIRRAVAEAVVAACGETRPRRVPIPAVVVSAELAGR